MKTIGRAYRHAGQRVLREARPLGGISNQFRARFHQTKHLLEAAQDALIVSFLQRQKEEALKRDFPRTFFFLRNILR